MADGISVGTVAVAGGILVGGVIVYSIARRKDLKVVAWSKRQARSTGQRTREMAAKASQAFRDGFAAGVAWGAGKKVSGIHGDLTGGFREGLRASQQDSPGLAKAVP